MARVSSTRVIISGHEDLLHAPEAQFFVWQGRVEVVADPDLALEPSERARLPSRSEWNQPRPRLASLRDHDFFALGGLLHQPREMGLRFVDIDGLHGELS